MSEVTPLPIAPPPGVVLTESDRAIEGRWSTSQGIRFVRGRPQKRGGWVRAVTTPTSGVPRAIHAWRDNTSKNYMAAGTYRKLYVYDSVWAQNDITPYRSTGTLGNNPISTVNGSPIVTIAHTAHGVSIGDTVYFANASTVGGVDMTTLPFLVATVPNANSYTITLGFNAIATATGGGAAVTYSYEVPIGTELGAYGLGWGVGGWGLSTWGTARTSSTIYIEPRIWSFDHFGQILLSSYNGGSIYTFDPTTAQPWGRAQVISAAPTDVRAMFVTPERFVFALRAGMVVGWCDQGDYTYWTAGQVGHTANTRTLTEGTKLVGGRVLGPLVSLVWTDGALYRFQYTGGQFVYDSALAGRDCGLIAPGAAVTVDGVAYWMGRESFWMYSGGVARMPNVEDIRAYVFPQLNDQTLYQAHAVYHPGFNQIEFFYTVTGQTAPTKSVTYDIATQCWWPDVLSRSAGGHFTQGDTRPYLASPDGYIYQHENTNDDNGVALPWSLVLSNYELNEGLRNMDIEGILFDFFQQSGSVAITVDTFDRLTDAAVMDTDSTTVPDTAAGLTDLRVSGRYARLTMGQTALGSYMRLGKPVAMVKQSGRRR